MTHETREALHRAAIRGELAAPCAGWLPAVLPWFRRVARKVLVGGPAIPTGRIIVVLTGR